MQKLRCCHHLWALAFVLVCCARVREARTCPSAKCWCRRHEIQCENASALGRIPKFSPQRQAPVYRTIDLTLLNISRVQNEAFANLKVRNIDLAKNPLGDNIAKNAFQGLEKILRRLDMSECSLTRIPSPAIRNLSTMKYLILDSNQITELRKNDFKRSLRRLDELHLSNNNITVLRKAVFSSLRRLSALYLSGNKIMTLTRASFRGLKNLQRLYLTGNSLTELRRSIFREMPNLLRLDVAANRINKLTTGVFQGLERLIWLDLSSNLIHLMERRALLSLVQLKYLNLRDNPLAVIAEGTFAPTRALSFLQLEVGGVINLSRRTFLGADRLSGLSLGRLNWTAVPDKLLLPLDALESLIIKDMGNQLAHFPIGVFSKKAVSKNTLEVVVHRTKHTRCDLNWVENLVKYNIEVKFLPATTSCNNRLRKVKARSGG